MAIVGLGALGLDLIEHAANDGGSFGPDRTGLDHPSFPADSKADVEQWANWLDESHVSHSGVKDVADVGWMLNFADPDGIALEIIYVDSEKLSQGPYAHN
jgi:glyoxylase I family protein